MFRKKRCSLKFRKFHRKTPVLESLFIKKRLQLRCFPVKFAKFLRTPILKNICERLLLKSVLSPGLPCLITFGSNWYLCFISFCIIIYRFACYHFHFNANDTAKIRNSPVVFCKKVDLTNFAKVTRKHLR